MIEMFNNKSVSLVGNAKSLLGKNYGSLIDNSDIVCRLNEGYTSTYPFRSDLYSSHGTRTDVVCINLPCQLTKKFNNVVVIQTTPNEGPPSGIVDYYIATSLVNELYKEMKPAHPSTGLRAIFMLLSFNISKLNIFGFDWKETPTFYGTNFENPLTDGHNFQREKEIIHAKSVDNDIIELYR